MKVLILLSIIYNLAFATYITRKEPCISTFPDGWHIEDEKEVEIKTSWGSNAYTAYECDFEETTPTKVYKYISYLGNDVRSTDMTLYCKDGREYDESSDKCLEPPECNQTKPDGWIAYPMSNGACSPYTDELKQTYASAGAPICDACFAEPYNETNCQAPNILDTSVSPATCIDNDSSSSNNEDNNTVPSSNCSETQIQDKDSNCIDFPDNEFFNSLDDSTGSKQTRSKSVPPENCIPGYEFYTTYAYFIVIGYDYYKNECIYQSYFCDPDSVFNKDLKKCEFPQDEEFRDDGYCPFGNYAKKDTVDCCGSVACIAYTGIDELDGTFKGGHKYYIYRCVKDIRIGYSVEVSCGSADEDDFDNVNIDLNGSVDDSNDGPIDFNSSTSDSEILNSIDSKLGIANDKLAYVGTKLDTISGKVTSIDSKLGIANDKLSYIGEKLNTATGELTNIGSKIDTTNEKLAYVGEKLNTATGELTKINDTLNSNADGAFENGSSLLNSNMGKFSLGSTSGLDDSSSVLDNLQDNFTDIIEKTTSIKSSFTDLEKLLKGDNTQLSVSNGSCSDKNINRFAGYISPYRSIFALITYVMAMLSIFKMIFLYLSKGD